MEFAARDKSATLNADISSTADIYDDNSDADDIEDGSNDSDDDGSEDNSDYDQYDMDLSALYVRLLTHCIVVHTHRLFSCK